jgi:hypothetical protein
METEVNELAAIPVGTSSMSAQIAVTPEGKQPKARRSSSPLISDCISITALLQSRRARRVTAVPTLTRPDVA